MVKIITAGEYRFGKEFVYSIGKISFDENGIAEVPDDLVEELLSKDSRLSLLEPKIVTPTPIENVTIPIVNDSNKVEESGVVDSVVLERTKKENELKALTVSELKECALLLPNVDKNAVDKMKKSDLVNLLIDKV